MMIPSAFREIAGKTEGLVLYAIPQPGDYIALMLEEEWERIGDRFTTDDPAPNIEDARNTAWFFSRSARLVCDSQGRVVIPEKLLRAVNMERDCDVIVAGMQRRIGIWLASRWNEYIESKDKEETYRQVRARVRKDDR